MYLRLAEGIHVAIFRPQKIERAFIMYTIPIHTAPKSWGSNSFMLRSQISCMSRSVSRFDRSFACLRLQHVPLAVRFGDGGLLDFGDLHLGALVV